ncbi:MAG: 2,3-bisphosphoglycerate-independent phosphoglycerate mutase [Candidatus Puniceispirillales bacterium]
MSRRPVLLCIMDGWGHREDDRNNAVRMAETPVIDQLDATVPKAFLEASGPAVGLPEGQVGNSEVGHMTIGAGRVVPQDLTRIDRACNEGSMASRPEFEDFAARLLETGGTAHLMGLVSPGGVHSRDDHLLALARALAERGITTAIHAFTDGRDTLPRLAEKTLPAFEKALPEGAFLATVTGRYFAMDRDNRWHRTETAWRVITFGEGEHEADNAAAAIALARNDGRGDEFILPTVITGYQGMRDGDALIMGNFRADRARQLLAAFCLDNAGFDASARPQLLPALGLVSYSDELDAVMTTLFAELDIPETLGEVAAEAGLSQLRLAETEKYPHVTFFLNGGAEGRRAGEDRSLIPSPQVATYDQQPEMSAEQVRLRLIEALESDRYDLIIINFANPDMVGHTGDLGAAIKAVETVDHAIGTILPVLAEKNGVMLLTADHGNCEIMWDDETGSPHTAHSYNPVPAWLIGGAAGQGLRDGGLADIAPTLLALLGIAQPAAMTGRSLLT